MKHHFNPVNVLYNISVVSYTVQTTWPRELGLPRKIQFEYRSRYYLHGDKVINRNYLNGCGLSSRGYYFDTWDSYRDQLLILCSNVYSITYWNLFCNLCLRTIQIFGNIQTNILPRLNTLNLFHYRIKLIINLRIK